MQPNATLVRIISIVGARPEFVQVAVLSRELRRRHEEILIHTGQHYDAGMSGRFFEDLAIPRPDLNLGIESRSPSVQTGNMLGALGSAIAPLDADLVVVRGDTNSTLAGAIVAKQLLLPLAHVEAGMRSYDRTMPEEINRVVTDHLADLQLVTDDDARARLGAEGIVRGIYVCGDVMYDLFLRARERAAASLPESLRALSREPARRYATAQAGGGDHRRILPSQRPGSARPAPAGRRRPTRCAIQRRAAATHLQRASVLP